MLWVNVFSFKYVMLIMHVTDMTNIKSHLKPNKKEKLTRYWHCVSVSGLPKHGGQKEEKRTV